MEREVFPKIDLFPRVTQVSRFILGIVRMPHELATHGDHFVEKRGAAEHLDTQLYEHPQLPLTYNRWDDQGCYYKED